MYQYTCPSGHVSERRGGLDESSAPCFCGLTAQRKGFNHVAVIGVSVVKEERQGVADYVEASHEVDYHYTKAENEGMPVKRPNLWKQAMKEAKKKGATCRSTSTSVRTVT